MFVWICWVLLYFIVKSYVKYNPMLTFLVIYGGWVFCHSYINKTVKMGLPYDLTTKENPKVEINIMFWNLWESTSIYLRNIFSSLRNMWNMNGRWKLTHFTLIGGWGGIWITENRNDSLESPSKSTDAHLEIWKRWRLQRAYLFIINCFLICAQLNIFQLHL